MTQILNGPQILCSGCGQVTNSIKPLCADCEASLAAFQLTPPDTSAPGDHYSEQGVRAWWLSDFEMYAGRDVESAIAGALEDWGGKAEDYFDDFDPIPVNLDEEMFNDGEPSDESAQRYPIRELIRRVLADPKAKLGFLCGLDA